MQRRIITFIVLILNIATINFETFGATKKKRTVLTNPRVQTSLVIDTKTKKVLHAENIRAKIHPASLTKLMTLYVMFEKIQSGELPLNKKLYVSKNAEKVIPLKLGLKAGTHITVREAIPAIIIHSANDASIIVAENISGSEAQFAKLMTHKARQLGMKDTVFQNASGLHHPEQKTTAVDLAILSFALKRDFPKYYPLFAQNSFEFRGKTIYGHNKVSENYHGVKYSKTGFTSASGFNIVTAADRGRQSLLGVVTGHNSAASRNQKMIQLFDKYFQSHIVSKNLKTIHVATHDKYKKPNTKS